MTDRQLAAAPTPGAALAFLADRARDSSFASFAQVSVARNAVADALRSRLLRAESAEERAVEAEEAVRRARTATDSMARDLLETRDREAVLRAGLEALTSGRLAAEGVQVADLQALLAPPHAHAAARVMECDGDGLGVCAGVHVHPRRDDDPPHEGLPDGPGIEPADEFAEPHYGPGSP